MWKYRDMGARRSGSIEMRYRRDVGIKKVLERRDVGTQRCGNMNQIASPSGLVLPLLFLSLSSLTVKSLDQSENRKVREVIQPM